MTSDRNTGMPKEKVSKNLPKYLNVVMEEYVLD